MERRPKTPLELNQRPPVPAALVFSDGEGVPAAKPPGEVIEQAKEEDS